MKSLHFYQQVRFKIVLLFGLITLGGMLLAWYSSIGYAEKEFRGLIFRQFSTVSSLAENGFSLIGQMGLIWARHSSLDPQLRIGLKQADSALYQQRLAVLAAEARADVAVLLDKNGIILAHTLRPERIGESLLSWSPVRQSLIQGQPATSILQDMSNLIIYSSSPLVEGHPEGLESDGIDQQNPAGIEGAILFGYAANDELLSQLSQGTQAGMTLVRRRAVMASTFNTSQHRLSTIPISYIGYQAMLEDPANIKLMPMAGENFFISAKRLDLMEPSQEGSILLSYPEQELDDIRQEISQRFTLIFVVIFLLLFLLSNWIARLVLGRIHDLVLRIESYSGGDADFAGGSADGGDEIDLLQGNFNQMLETIHSKNLELHKQGQLLDARVAERTRVLQQLNAKLERHAQQLSQAQKLASYGSWEYDPRSDRFDCSPEAMNILGLDEKSFDGHLSSLLEAIHPEERLKLSQLLQRTQREERSISMDLRLRPRSGKTSLVHLRSEALRDLKGAVESLSGSLQDVTERKETEALLVQQANYDELTGIPNRNLFWDRLHQAIGVAHREGHYVAVIFIDLDRFKEINDNLGHDAGDLLLQQVAGRLKQCLRDADTVARFGGDEFIIILPSVEGRDECASTAERIIFEVSRPVELSETDTGYVGGSLGIALYPQDAKGAEDLVKRADSAMYQSKKGGRNRYSFYSADEAEPSPAGDD